MNLNFPNSPHPRFFSFCLTLVLSLAATSFMLAQNNLDCIDAIRVCDDNSIDFNPEGIGEDDFEDINNNSGCLTTGERAVAWYFFQINQSAPSGLELEFVIDPEGTPDDIEDYDFAVWGPDLPCDSLGLPIRCSYAGGFCEFCPLTGLGMGAIDETEGAGGDGFVAPLVVNPGETYILLIDNFAMDGNGFNLSWSGAAAPFLNCCMFEFSLTPEVEFCSFEALPSYTFDLEFVGSTEGYTYQWTSENGQDFLDDPTIQNPTVTFPEGVGGEFVYNVTITDTSGCDVTASVTIIGNYFESNSVILQADDPCTSENICRTMTADFGAGENYTLLYTLDGDTLSVFADSSLIEFELCEEGEYQFLGFLFGDCPSVVLGDTIVVVDPSAVSISYQYDFDDCDASTGETSDYGEFGSEMTCVFPCAEAEISPIFRDPSNVFRHSCTPGQEGAAICVGALDDCNYVPGSEHSLVWEVQLDPEPNTFVTIDSLSFFERAPEVYDWIGGDSGPNNFPVLYGLRITLNGVQVFIAPTNFTETEWNLETFGFEGIEINQNATIRFELLPYCLTGNGAEVNAWDIDELEVFFTCNNVPSAEIQGTISHLSGEADDDVAVHLHHLDILIETQFSDHDGQLLFENLPFGGDYVVIPESTEPFLTSSVSTMDLLMIQNHLLGVEEFDEVYSYIAADVSGDNQISVQDLLQLRAAILGLQSESMSWKYINDYDALTLEAPFDFEEEAVIPVFAQETIFPFEFTSVKMGDISGEQNGTERELDDRSELRSTILDWEHLEDGSISIRIAEDMEFQGLQLALEMSLYDEELSVISSIIPSQSLFTSQKDKVLRLSAILPAAVELEVGTEILRIKSIADLNNELTDVVFYDELYAHVDGVLNTLKVDWNAGSDEGADVDEMTLVCTPNPFNDRVVLDIISEKSGPAIIELMDVNGAVLHSETQFLAQGTNTIILNPELSKNGVYVVSVSRSGVRMAHQRLVRIDR